MPKWPWTFNKVHDTSPKNHQISPEISVLSLRDGVRAERLTPFCPNSNLSELIKYLFGFEVILFKGAKLDLVFEHFFFFWNFERFQDLLTPQGYWDDIAYLPCHTLTWPGNKTPPVSVSPGSDSENKCGNYLFNWFFKFVYES